MLNLLHNHNSLKTSIMSGNPDYKAIDILMVEDNHTDAIIAKEALIFAKVNNTLNIVNDGVEAIDYLFHKGKYINSTTPDLILLDLNLPKMNGHEVLAIIKKDEELKNIPVVMLTTSKANEDVVKSYELDVNCYITKPVDFDQFTQVVRSIEHFWFTIAYLPETKQ